MKYKEVVFSTAYFPPISYFTYMLAAENPIIDGFEHYHKQSYRNRCNLYNSNGQQSLVIPVSTPLGNHTPTNQVQISFQEPWQRTHWRSIESAYNKSPFFMYYSEEIKAMLYSEELNLFTYNRAIFASLCELLEIEIEPASTKEYYKGTSKDLRNSISPKSIIAEINSILTQKPYYQIFEDRSGFISDLSILDLLFHLGPESGYFLETTSKELTINKL